MGKPSLTKSTWNNIKQVLFVAVMFVFMKTSLVEAFKIPSQSMEDTLLVGDFLLANKFVYGAHLPLVDLRLPAWSEPEPGDIVIFLFPGDRQTRYIKRCVAGPGDTVQVINKVLYVDGAEFKMPEHGKFIDTNALGGQNLQPRRGDGLDSRDNFGPYVVPDASYFMMGDNRDNSYDSRYWGAVPYELILGEALVIHWSWDDSNYPSPDVSIGDPLSVPRLFIHNAARFVQKVRWHRLFSVIS